MLSETSKSSGPTSEVEFPQKDTNVAYVATNHFCTYFQIVRDVELLLLSKTHKASGCIIVPLFSRRCDQAQQRKVYSKTRRCSEYVEQDAFAKRRPEFKYAVSRPNFADMTYYARTYFKGGAGVMAG